MSKEHVFPNWLKRYFPRDASSLHTAAHLSWSDLVISKQPKENRRVGQGHVGSKKLRIVCEDCNTGWMHDLEEWAKEVLPLLIYGKEARLLPAGQAKLAAWATKIVMVAEFLEPRETGISQAERTTLYETKCAPNNWLVWIAAYDGSSWANQSIYQNRGRMALTLPKHPKDAPFYVQATTFGIGHVLFCAVSSDAPTVKPGLLTKTAEGLERIWPNTPERCLFWPTYRILGDPEANAVANILNLSGVFDHTFDPAKDWNFTF